MKKEVSGMELSIILTVGGIWSKLIAIFSTCWGWVVGLFTFILAFLLPVKDMFILLFIIIAADMLFGIWASIIQKKSITSSKLRGTIIKTMIYLVVLSLSFAIENQLGWSLICKVLFSIASSIELYSVIANLLIIHPNTPFLKIFTILLSGEIAAKIGITKKEVEELINKKIENEKNGNL